MKDENNKNRLVMFELTVSKLIISALFLVLITPSYALNNENIKWSSSVDTYKLVPTDNMVTYQDYTIKAIEFPAPVRGYSTVNGSINPERPVSPFVKFELYKDIINNTSPIDTFALGIGDEYIMSDQETRITIGDIPNSMSQDWVYEYYNPWVSINVQKRAVPNLDIGINLIDSSGNSIDETNIRTGDHITAEITITNSGEDVLDNMSFNVDIGQLSLNSGVASNKLTDTIGQFNQNEQKIIDVPFMVPGSLEEKEYDIYVTATGQDIKDIVYNFNVSKIITSRSDIDAISVEKRVAKNTSYLTEYVSVTLNIVNTGLATINNVRIHDTIPDGLTFVKDGVVQNYTELLLNKSSIGPSESWTIDYSLKPSEPGIYILPQFDTNFSVGGEDLRATSEEVGFRIFGPCVVLNKSAMDMGNGIVNVTVDAKNVGNGPTRAVIEDQLPDNTDLISGSMNATVFLNADEEKAMEYTIKAHDINISKMIWPPAKATYYLDDWRFYTSSDKKYEEGHTVEDRALKGGTGVYVIVSTPVGAENVYQDVTVPQVEVTVPQVTEEQKQVVATIPAETPTKTPEKSTPGFTLYEFVLLSTVIILSKKMNKKSDR
jgi:uncharacterized repeat protein (TIGR01451 family)